MFYEWNGFKLRLDAKRIVELEDKLGGKSPLSILAVVQENKLPSLKDLLLVLHLSLQPYHHGFTLEKVYELYDNFTEEGHTFNEFLQVIIEVYKSSGLIPKEVNEKN